MTQLRLIGRAAVLLPGAGAEHLLERKDAALLALLALDGPVPRSRVAGLLWPQASAVAARGNLRQRLFRLRVATGGALVQPGSTLRLLDDVTLDIAALHQRLLDDPHAGQGDLLAGLDYSDHEELEHWVAQARDRWRATRLGLLAQLASDHESRREIAAALALAQRLLIDEPLLEHAHRRVMRLHYLRGDRAAALAAYERCRSTLGEQLGLRPSPETVELARMVEASAAHAPVAPAPRPVTTLRPPFLVGREAEWQRAGALLAQGGCVLVIGEAGIGKTRFMAERAAASAGEEALECGARAGDARLPYALAARLAHRLFERWDVPPPGWSRAELARIAPLPGDAAPGPLVSGRLAQALAAALDAARAAGLSLLALDDLHFADEASLELLPALVDALRSAALPGLFALRPADHPPALQAWLAASDPAAMERIELGPLAQDAVQALLQSLTITGLDAAAWSGALKRHAGGNPLFVLETLTALLDRDPSALQRAPPTELPAPANVGALIERRLALLGPGALKLARLAAVAGPDFGVALAVRVLGQHALDIADHWRELESAGVIRDDGLAHDLVREAALRSVPDAIGRALHAAVAAVLDADAAAPARIALHWEAAHDWERAAGAFEAAARAALAASRHADEAALWQRAIACREDAGQPRAAFAARCASFEAVLAARPLHEAQALAERVLTDADGDGERLHALRVQTLVYLVQQRGAEALSGAREALVLARRLERPAQELDAARGHALALAQCGHGGEAAALLVAYEATVESAGSLRQRYDYWADLAYVLNDAQRRQESKHAWERAHALAVALGDRHELVTVSTNLSIMAAFLGQPALAYESALQAQRLQHELGHDNDIVAGAAAMNLGSFGLLLGHFDEALASFETALACFGRGHASAWLASCRSNLASAWLQLGQTARALQTLTPPEASLRPASAARRAIVAGRIDRALGRSARPRLEAALALLGDDGDPVQHALARIDLSRELDPPEAAALCRSVFERAEASELFGVASKALLYEIEAALRAGDDLARVTALAIEAEQRFETRSPMDCYRGEILWPLYQAHAAMQSARAPSLLQEAARWVRKVARERVPEPFRDSFLHRQPVNRALLASAGCA